MCFAVQPGRPGSTVPGPHSLGTLGRAVVIDPQIAARPINATWDKPIARLFSFWVYPGRGRGGSGDEVEPRGQG